MIGQQLQVAKLAQGGQHPTHMDKFDGNWNADRYNRLRLISAHRELPNKRERRSGFWSWSLMPDPLVHARASETHSQATTPPQATRRVLLAFPCYSPSFGTFEYAFPLVGAKAFMPPHA